MKLDSAVVAVMVLMLGGLIWTSGRLLRNDRIARDDCRERMMQPFYVSGHIVCRPVPYVPREEE